MFFKKNFLPVLFFSVFIGKIFCFGGDLSGAEKILKIETEYFEIIYVEESENAALRIEKVCDSMYEFLCGKFNVTPSGKIPVTITNQVESFNAYFSAAPYNRIVLYDTFIDSDLAVYENSLESVFFHELTHKVSLNSRSKFWDTASKIFADALNPAWISFSTFWNEGATVSFESMDGGGRLNDPFSTQIILQAKIENKFPSWRDVLGARDIYPGGNASYIFGGAFASFLQEKYGIEKYSEFWRNAGSFITPSFSAGVFKRTYGISVDSAWREFEESVKILEKIVPNEPEFFKGNTKNFTVTDFDTFDKGIVWYESKSQTVYSAEFNPAGGGESETGGKKTKNEKFYRKIKRIFTFPNVQKISVSDDGKYLAVTSFKNENTVKSYVYIYELSSKKLAAKTESGNFDGTVYKDENGKYFLLTLKWKNSPKLCIYSLCDGKLSERRTVNFGENELVYSPCYAGNGKFAFIHKEKFNWKIRILEFTDSEGNVNSKKSAFKTKDFSPSDSLSGNNAFRPEVILKNLRSSVKQSEDGVNKTEFYFSWAEFKTFGKMLPRSGILKFSDQNGEEAKKDTEGIFAFQKNNLAGGILEFYPLKNGKFLALSSFYRNKNLCEVKLDFEKFPAQSKNSAPGVDLAPRVDLAPSENLAPGVDLAPRVDPAPSENSCSEKIPVKYSGLKYYRNGVLLPLGTSSLFDDSFNAVETAFAGLTYISSNPWGDKISRFSAGYGIMNNFMAVSAGISGGNNSFSYSFSTDFSYLFKGKTPLSKNKREFDFPWQSISSFSLSKYIFTAKNSYTSFLLEDEILFTENYALSVNRAGITFSNVRKYFPESKQFAGIFFSPYISASLVTDYSSHNALFNAGFSCGFYVPGIFPLRFAAEIFPVPDEFIDFSARLCVFNAEIQKGIPALSLYAVRFSLSAIYAGTVNYNSKGNFEIFNAFKDVRKTVEENFYEDKILLRGELEMNVNTGIFASPSYAFSVFVEGGFFPHSRQKWQISAGLKI